MLPVRCTDLPAMRACRSSAPPATLRCHDRPRRRRRHDDRAAPQGGTGRGADSRLRAVRRGVVPRDLPRHRRRRRRSAGPFRRLGLARGPPPQPVFRHPPGTCARTPTSPAPAINPLVHYIRFGEAREPLALPAFRPALVPRPPRRPRRNGRRAARCWRTSLQRRRTGQVTPVAEFDAAWYLQRYPDIAAAGVDPFEHYLLWGWREGRNPSAALRHRLLRAPLPGSRSRTRTRCCTTAGCAMSSGCTPHRPAGESPACTRRCASSPARGPAFEEVQPPAGLGAAARHGAGLLSAAISPDSRE